MKFTDYILKQPFWGGKVDIHRIYEFIEYRCFEEARPDKMKLLHAIGLDE